MSVLLIAAVTMLLGLNLWRVATNARNSFEVYLFEQEALTDLESTHERLEAELAYYNSYEYKKLYARDNLRLAEPDETLYRIVSRPDYYELEKLEVDFFEDGEYFNWWMQLL